MKKNALLTSILTITLCLCLIAGSTYALFTSSDEVTVEVDSGRVEITAGLEIVELFSVTPDGAGAEYDEYGNRYTYVTPTSQNPATTFTNGGTATCNGNLLELSNVTPGDKVVFKLHGTNGAEVAVQYRYKIECVDGYELMSAFVVTVEGTKYASMATYTSGWETLALNESIMTGQDEGITLAIELPVSVGDALQNKSADIRISLEAVQSNADTSATAQPTVKYITTADTAEQLAAKIKSDEYLHIFVKDDIVGTVLIDQSIANKTIDGNGHYVELAFAKGANVPEMTVENVVITDIVTETLTMKSGISGDITVKDSIFRRSAVINKSKALFEGAGGGSDKLDVTIDNCDFFANGNVASAVYFYRTNNLTIRNSDFYNTTSWAVLNNGPVYANVVISDCYFDTCTGIMKANVGTGDANIPVDSLLGNFTFANNVLVNCVKKEANTNKGDYTYMVANLSGNNIRVFSNNLIDDVVSTEPDLLLVQQ